MKEETKKQFNKAFVIAFTALSLILIVVGICLLINITTTGADSNLESTSGMDLKVRSNVTHLTDEEFIYGVKHLVPEDVELKDTWFDALSRIDARLEEALGQQVYTEYFDSFGEPALYLVVTNTADLAVVTAELSNAEIFTKIHIMTADAATGLVESEYIYSGGELAPLYTPHDITSIEAPIAVATLIADLCTEYGLSSELFTYSGDELRIDVTQISLADVLCIFDYSYQVCLRDKLSMNLVVFSNEVLCANAHVSEDSIYETYYPDNDLAPLFRLTYYYKNNFFKNNLRSTCELYI